MRGSNLEQTQRAGAPPQGLGRRGRVLGCVLLRLATLHGPGREGIGGSGWKGCGGTLCPLHVLLSAPHVSVPEYHATCVKAGVSHPVGLGPGRVCTRVSVFGVCLSVAQL